MKIAAIIPAKSAIKPAPAAQRVFLIPTEPKQTART